MVLSRVELTAIATLLLASSCATGTTGGVADWTGRERTLREDDQPAPTLVFDTPEDTVFATPWFTVSSVVLRVRRMQNPTVIVLPEGSEMRAYMRNDPAIVTTTTDVPPANRFLFGLGLVTDDMPPFSSEPDRYRYPDLYE